MTTFFILNYSRIFLEGNFITIIKWTGDGTSTSHSCPLFQNVQNIASRLGSFQMTYIFREASSTADWLARRPTNGDCCDASNVHAKHMPHLLNTSIELYLF